MATSSNPNYNYDLEKEALARRQKLVEALQMSALQPMQMPPQGPVASRMNPLQAMLPALQAYFAQQAGEGVKADSAELSKRYNDDLVKGIENFARTSNGYTQTANLEGPNEDGSAMSGMYQTQIPGDKQKAVLDALATNHPVLKELAMKQLTAEDKNALHAKDLLPYIQPSAIPDLASKGMAGFKPKKEIKEAGGTFYDVGGDKPTAMGGQTFGEPVVINGDLYQTDRDTGKLVKLDNAPKVTVGGTSVAVDAGKKEGMKHYWTAASDKVKALGEASYAAQQNMQTLSELRNLDKQGIFSNVTTGPATFLNNLGQVAGVPVDASKLGNTESFNALTTDLWQGLVSKYGGNRGVTQQEAAEIKKMLPLSASSPQAREQLYNILENVAKRQMVQYQRANMAFAKAAKMDDPEIFAQEFGDIFNPTPNTPAPTTQAPKRVRFEDLP